MNNLTKLALIALLSACGRRQVVVTGPAGPAGAKGDPGTNAAPCTVTVSSAGAVLTCPDQDAVLISNGAVGPRGFTGAQGEPAVINDVDPCPANNGGISGHQERFLCINDALYAVYYAPPYSFLTRLKDGVNYVTTDNRSCHFQVITGCQIQ